MQILGLVTTNDDSSESEFSRRRDLSGRDSEISPEDVFGELGRSLRRDSSQNLLSTDTDLTEGPLVNRLQVSGFFGFVGLSFLLVKLYSWIL